MNIRSIPELTKTIAEPLDIGELTEWLKKEALWYI